jgi:CubicO group peptidase (beta-lactamase class C family)
MAAGSIHDLRSVTKSVVSALAGIALGDGAIKSLDQPVVEWFPEYLDLNTADRRRLTLAHVMGMTSGLEWNEDMPYTDPRNDEIRMTRDPDPLHYALSRAFAHDPGAEFTYNGGLVQVMAAVIQRAVKMPIQDYARKKLWEPLGIDTVEWVGTWPACRARPRDSGCAAATWPNSGHCTCMAANGTAGESCRLTGSSSPRAGISASRVKRGVTGRVPRRQAEGAFGYAYFWWYSCYPTSRGLVEARTGVGNGQQRIFVLRGLDMVVTILAGRYNDFTTGNTLATRILQDHAIPAVRSGVRAGCPGS